jgi:hypothetical protein
MLSFSIFITGVTSLNSESDSPIDPGLSMAPEEGNLGLLGHRN